MIQIFSADGRTDGTGPTKGSTRGPRGPKKERFLEYSGYIRNKIAILLPCLEKKFGSHKYFFLFPQGAALHVHHQVKMSTIIKRSHANYEMLIVFMM